MEINKKKKILAGLRKMIPTMLVLAIIGALYVYASSRLTTMPDFQVHPENGIVDVREVPIETEVYHLVNSWDFYPGVLYYPIDFYSGNVELDPQPDEVKSPHLGTYRVKILAKPNTYLMIASYSIDYSTRIFVNGVEVRSFGYVSEDPEKTVHNGHYYTLPLYSDDDGEIEIIYQYANYMHHQGGFIQNTVISSPEKIDEYVRGMTLFSFFTGGGLLFFAFYFLLYSAYMHSREFGVLSLCCVLISMRNSHFLHEYLMPMDFPFEPYYRVFILSVSMIPTMGVFLPAAYFPKLIKKKYELVFTVICGIDIVLHCVLPTTELVALCHYSYYFCAACAVAVLIRAIWMGVKKAFTFSDVVTLLILLALFLVMMYEGISSGSNSFVAHFGMTPFGLLVCLLLLSLNTQRKIQKRMELLTEEQHKNEVLGQINAMNRDFLQTVAHELRTPLSVISGYAQLTQMQIEKGKLSPQTPERLETIRSEADRLGAMVSNLMASTYGEVKEAERKMVDPRELLHQAELIGGPVCDKKGNRLETECSTDALLHANFELLLQVLLNLIVNASRHTDKGQIRVKVTEEGKDVVFTVSDTGTGIPENILPHIFERGYTTDSGNGLGLSICLDTVRMHGGDLTVESTGPEGSVFRFTIPKEAQK